MSLNLTQTILTQIAFKRLSGKAMTSGRLSLAEEKLGSSTQTSNATIFGQALPNNPNNSTAFDYKIQSASDGSPGTVQRVILDLVKIDGTSYSNAAGVEVGSLMSSSATNFNQDGEDVQSDFTIAPRQGFNAALGDATSENTFHAYSVKLPANYQTVGGTDVGFAANAGTSKTLGDAPYANSFMSTGSVQFQIVPEFVSTITGTTNPYIPQVTASNGAGMASTHAVDYYFDTFAGILFVQDPIVAEGSTSSNQPGTIKAFLYVGKFQNEIEGDSVDLHFSASAGSGFSFANNATASFTTGSTSGEGLTTTAGSTNDIEFTLVNVISGSEQITGLGGLHISASDGNEFDVAFNQSASFESDSAGISVSADATKTIKIGKSTDNVTFNQITGSSLIITNTASISYLETIFETASVIYTSGSTKFGNTLDDFHNFTGSIELSSSGVDGFTWDTPEGSTVTIPLVYDASTKRVLTGSDYFKKNEFGIHLSASGGTGFSLTNLSTASFTTGSTSGGGLTITAGATNDIEYTLVGVISSSGQILDGTGILSSSTQDFATYSSSVETLIANATASITQNETDITNATASITQNETDITNATASITVNETNITELQASASAGIAVSGSLGGVTSIPLMGTASFIGGTGITITNSSGEITIDSDTGELSSPFQIRTGSSTVGTSIAYGGTASFAASGTGLTVDETSGTVTYTVNPAALVESVDTATVINITSSYAETASIATNAQVTTMNSGIHKLLGINQGTTLTGPAQIEASTALVFDQASVNLAIGNLSASGVGTTTHNIQSNAATVNLFTDNTPVVNVGQTTKFVNFLGSASIAGDLIVNGTTTTLNTQNLLVEDKYILLASSSTANTTGGGIVIQRGSTTSGTALHWDHAKEVWAVDIDGANASSAGPLVAQAAMVFASHSAGNPTTGPLVGGGNDANYKLGQMYVNTADSDSDGNTIWIYAT